MGKGLMVRVLRGCRQGAKRCLPSALVRKLKALVRPAPLSEAEPEPAAAVPSATVLADEVGLQLDAILRELRRLHLRLEELHAARTETADEQPWPPQDWIRPANAA